MGWGEAKEMIESMLGHIEFGGTWLQLSVLVPDSLNFRTWEYGEICLSQLMQSINKMLSGPV